MTAQAGSTTSRGFKNIFGMSSIVLEQFMTPLRALTCEPPCDCRTSARACHEAARCLLRGVQSFVRCQCLRLKLTAMSEPRHIDRITIFRPALEKSTSLGFLSNTFRAGKPQRFSMKQTGASAYAGPATTFERHSQRYYVRRRVEVRLSEMSNNPLLTSSRGPRLRP